MSLSIMLTTTQNLGDHGETRRVAVPYVEGETVEELVDRIGKVHGRWVGVTVPKVIDKHDVVEIRIIEPTPEPSF